MLITIVAAVAIAAGPQEPVKLASPGFSAVNVQDKLATFFSDHFAQQLALKGLRVLTASEISALLGLERQKQLLGCAEDSSSCMAELANALGADGIIVGSLAKLDDTYQVNLKIVSAKDAATLSVFSAEADGDKQLLKVLNDAAQRMAPEVLRNLRPGDAPQTSVAGTQPSPPGPEVAAVQSAPAASSGRKWPLVPTIAGGVLVAGGAVLMLAANGERDSAMRASTVVEARKSAVAAQNESTIGAAALGVGAAALVTAGIMYGFSGGGDAVQVSALPTASGAAFSIAGSF